MKLIEIPISAINGDIEIDESAGTLTFQVKGTVLGTPEDFKFNLPLGQLLSGIATGMSNPIIKYLLSALAALL